MQDVESQTLESFEIFPWSADFETGIAVVDSQHRELVHLLNEAAKNLVRHDVTLEMVARTMNGLTQYVSVHFASEEAIMAPSLRGDAIELEHRSEHQTFVAEVERLKADALQLAPSMSIEQVVAFLTRWLGFHILNTDRRMAKIVLAVGSGLDVASAKEIVDREMSGTVGVLVDAVLRMYEKLSSRTFLLMKEISERIAKETALRTAAIAVNGSQDAIFVTDSDLRITDANPAFCRLFGRSREEVLGICADDAIEVNSEGSNLIALGEQARLDGQWGGEVRVRHADGGMVSTWLNLSHVIDSAGESSSYVGIFADVEQLMERQGDLERMALQDPLTSLPNRVFLSERLRQAVSQAKRDGTYLAVCYLDLDGFKEVNDRLGHASGDELLRTVGARFRRTLRANDTVARMGGDEFALLLGELADPNDCTPLLQRFLADIGEVFDLPNGSAKVSASIGVTIFPLDNVNPDTLLHHADLAMYQAKRNGKSRLHVYTASPR